MKESPRVLRLGRLRPFVPREPFHALVLFEMIEDLLNRFSENGMNEAGFDLCKWNENELTIVETGVRNLEFFRVNLFVIEKEKVEIDRPRAPAKRLLPTEA